VVRSGMGSAEAHVGYLDGRGVRCHPVHSAKHGAICDGSRVVEDLDCPDSRSGRHAHTADRIVDRTDDSGDHRPVTAFVLKAVTARTVVAARDIEVVVWSDAAIDDRNVRVNSGVYTVDSRGRTRQAADPSFRKAHDLRWWWD